VEKEAGAVQEEVAPIVTAGRKPEEEELTEGPADKESEAAPAQEHTPLAEEAPG